MLRDALRRSVVSYLLMSPRAGSDFEPSTRSTFDKRANFFNGRSVCDDSRILGEPSHLLELSLRRFPQCNVQNITARGGGVGIVRRGDNSAFDVLADQGALDASD